MVSLSDLVMFIAAACNIYQGKEALQCRSDLDRCVHALTRREERGFERAQEAAKKSNCDVRVLTEEARDQCWGDIYAMLPWSQTTIEKAQHCAVKAGLFKED